MERQLLRQASVASSLYTDIQASGISLDIRTESTIKNAMVFRRVDLESDVWKQSAEENAGI